MRSDIALADRKQSVREAAQEWLHAGWIDNAAWNRIENMYADDRARVGIAFRILFFVLVLSAILGVLGTLSVFLDIGTKNAGFTLIAGIACWGIAGYLILVKKRRQGGIETAFSVAAIINLVIAFLLFLFANHVVRDDSANQLALLALSLLTGVAAWNWGYWPYAAISSGVLFSVIATLPGGRPAWFLLTVVSAPWLLRSSDSLKLPPSLRKCSAAFLTVAISALYASINLYVVDQHILDFHNFQIDYRWLWISLTALVPMVVFVTGLVHRRRLFLVLGFLFGLLSLITLRMYVHLAPLWATLIGAGILVLAIAGVLRRFLDSGVHGERAGYTAALLAERPDKHRGVEILANVAAFTPGTAPSAENSHYQGGGGEFGGGGASGTF